MRRLAALILIWAGVTVQAEQPEAFEVVSLKPSAAGTRITSKLDRAQFTGTAHTLAMLIESAFPNLRAPQLKGPDWIHQEKWDFAAKLPSGMPADEEKLYRRTEAMLQIFLAERFHLKVNWETKEQPVYTLVASGGNRLKPSEPGQPGISFANGRVEFRHLSMEDFTHYLSPSGLNGPTDRPVLDKTGLPGFYDFSLDWSPSAPRTDGTGDNGSIFTALSKVGLKLVPQKGPVEYLVVDHAEKPVADRD